jgi:NAD(P)-dependent dehydrogenase (short-subunit alcohol dehydrogenase family)
MNRAIVITGCSSGIGRACAVRLSSAGFRVFAGVRNAADARSLESFCTPLQLDVTSPDSVAAACAAVAEDLDGAPLWGVVNNAGVSIPGPLERVTIEEVRLVLEVNLLGVLRVAQTFLPQLRGTGGRIVNIGSGEGFLATPVNGAYCMSKHALEALSESLRIELAPAGIAVCLVEPGQTETVILQESRQRYSELEAVIGASHAGLYDGAIRARAAMSARVGMPPERVAAVVERALTARKPRARYFVGLDVRGAVLLGRFVPSRLRDFFFTRVLGFPGRR